MTARMSHSSRTRPMSISRSPSAGCTRCAHTAPIRHAARRCSARCSGWSPRATGAGWRGASVAAGGLRPTPVLDRKMFKSVYFREPSGVLLEVATDQPGFVFEPPEQLGESLVLIGDLEHRRAELERRFPLLRNPRASQTPERT